MEEEILTGKTLLVVDDETDLRDIVASELEFMGAKVHQAENVAVAKHLYKNHKIDLIVSDIRMPGGTGIDLLDFIKTIDVNVPPIILITGFADITVEDAFNKGAEALMNKPFKLDDLIKQTGRLTKSLNERLSDPDIAANKSFSITFDETVQEKIDKRELAFGRGGFAIKLDTKGKRIDLNDPIELSFKFKDLDLKGIGVCRWQKHLDQGHLISMGVELLTLKSEGLSLFEAQKNKIPFIPVL